MNTICSGCGLVLPRIEGLQPDRPIGASPECQKLCAELGYYTLQRRDPFFIHQVFVDSYAAQHSQDGAPAIGLAFALVGLWLVVERGGTGKQAQDLHIRLAKRSKDWPLFTKPALRGALTVADVLKAEAGPPRDTTMLRWAAAVWTAYAHEHAHVRQLLKRHGES